MARKIEVQVVGDSRSLERAGRESSRLSSSLHKVGVMAKWAGAAVAAGAVVGLEKSVHAALDAEASQARLEQAFKASGLSLKPYSKAIEEVEAKSRKLGFTDTEVRQSLGSLTVATHSYSKSAKDLGVAQDLARFKHLELADATKMLTMAMTGSQRAAKQLGITVIPLTTNVDKLKASHVNLKTALGHSLLAQAKLQDKMALGQAVIAQVTAKTKGQADVYGKTAAGALAKFSAEFDHLKVTIGTPFLKSLGAVADGLSAVVGWVGKLAKAPSISIALDIAGSGLKDLGGRIKDSIAGALSGTDWSTIGRQLAIVIGSSIVFTSDALNGMLTSISAWVGGHAQQIAAIGAELAVRMVLTLTDPAFWAHHLDLLFLVISAAFFKGFGRLGGVIGKELGRVIGPLFRRVGGEAALLFMEGVSRLPSLVGDAFAALSTIAARGISGLVAEVGRAPGFFARVFKLGVLVTVFRVAIQGIQNAWAAFTGWIAEHALLTVRKIVEPFTHLPWGLGKKAQEAKDAINHQLDLIHHRIPITVAVEIRMPGGGFRGPKGQRAFGDGIVGAVSSQTRSFAAANPAMFMPPMASATGSAAGLKPMILDDLALGRSMGLSLSSGYRPGAVTSSGHQSLHSVGQAIDMVGSPFAMSSYALAEAGRSGIAEVIYSPVGWWHPGSGWGPVTDPTIKAGHYSHVHVGARSGDGKVGASGDGRVGGGKKARPARSRGRLTPGLVGRLRDKAPQLPGVAELPLSIQEAIADADLTEPTADDIAAYRQAEAFLAAALNRPLTQAQRIEVKQALKSVRDTLRGFQDTAGGGPSADLQAQLDQANARLGVANRSAALANAFVATGVFGGAGAGASGGPTIIFNSVVPYTTEQAKIAAAAAAEGASGQPYRTSSQDRLGV